MRLNVKDLGDPERLADLDLMIWGDNLHAPLIERIVELPMDIYGGVHPHIACKQQAMLVQRCRHCFTQLLKRHVSFAQRLLTWKCGLDLGAGCF